MSSVIFKTHADYLPKVVQNATYALNGRPKNLAPGDTILIAQTRQSLPRGEKQIHYRMTFVGAELDKDGKTDRIFGRHWRYIIVAEALKELRLPFDISDIVNPSKNYEQGGSFVYVARRDEAALQECGHFDTVDNA